MLTAPCYIISDAHLGFAPADVERAVISFIRHVAERGGSLVINGDLFEFWFEWRTVIPRRGFRTLAALADVADAGVPVVMIAGNHDCWGGDVLRRTPASTTSSARGRRLAGWRTRIEHGDGLRPTEDRRYRLLRHVLRNRWRFARSAGCIRTSRLGWRPDSSHASRTYSARDGGRGLRDAAARAGTRIDRSS